MTYIVSGGALNSTHSLTTVPSSLTTLGQRKRGARRCSDYATATAFRTHTGDGAT